MNKSLLVPLVLVMYAMFLMAIGYYVDIGVRAKDMEIHTLEVEVEGLHKMIAAGITIPVYDGIPVKRPKAMKPKE